MFGQLLYSNDVVLMSQTIMGLRNCLVFKKFGLKFKK